MKRLEPIRISGNINPETNEKEPDMLIPPENSKPVEFRDGAYWENE